MSKRSGATAARHAYAWAIDTYGAHNVLKSGQRLVWIRDKRTGESREISLGEDLFGVADLLILRSIDAHEGPLLVQVTTQGAPGTGGGAVSARKRKCEAWLRQGGGWRCTFWLIAWVKGKHFRCWVWLPHGSHRLPHASPSPASGRWEETEPFWSPKATARVMEKQKEERWNTTSSASRSSTRRGIARAHGVATQRS